MISERKRRRAVRRVKPGDGHKLKPMRWWQPFSRTLFHLRLTTDDGEPELWTVDVRPFGDSNGEVKAQLYHDGDHHAESKVPAAFQVPGGVIEVDTSGYGLKRCHYVQDDGSERQLVPDRASAEGKRARLERKHPALGRALGVVSITVLLVSFVLGIPQLIEQITRIPPVAEHLGTFVSPIQLPFWFNTGLVIAALLASTERALRLRYNWLLDGGVLDGMED